MLHGSRHLNRSTFPGIKGIYNNQIAYVKHSFLILIKNILDTPDKMIFFKDNPRLNGVLIVVCGVMVLTPDGLLTTLITADIWTMLFWRGFLMAITLTIFSIFTIRIKTISKNFVIYDRETLKYSLYVALLFAVSSISFVIAIVNTNVANTLFLITISPLFAAGFAYIFLHEPVSKTTIIVSLITIIGMLIIFGDGIDKGNLSGNLSKEEILEQLKQNTVGCKDVSFRILGFSLAAINTIFSIILSGIFIILFKNYGKN